MTYHGVESYIKPESKLPKWQPFHPDSTDLHRNRFNCPAHAYSCEPGSEALVVWTRL